MRKPWWQDTCHLGAIEDSLQIMWQRELLRKGMKKGSVLALERFTESRSLQKNPAQEQSTDTPIKRHAGLHFSSSSTAILFVQLSELGDRVKDFVLLIDLCLLPSLPLVVVLNRSTTLDDLHLLLILLTY